MTDRFNKYKYTHIYSLYSLKVLKNYRKPFLCHPRKSLSVLICANYFESHKVNENNYFNTSEKSWIPLSL